MRRGRQALPSLPAQPSPPPRLKWDRAETTVVRVLNRGTAPATINTLNIVGQGFALASTPTLPQTIAPNTSLVLTVSFTPVRVGAHPATLVINSDVFNLAGNGLGSGLSYCT